MAPYYSPVAEYQHFKWTYCLFLQWWNGPRCVVKEENYVG